MARRDDSAVSIADTVERLGRMLRARGFAHDLNPAQWEALRFLERCNRFSNNPSSLAGFLGATKGTVSQTVSSLERKGLVRKVPRAGHGRALSIELTDRGRAVLARDPLDDLTAAADGLGEDAPHLADQLLGLLAECQYMYGIRSFGRCRTCAYFLENAPAGNPHRCSLLGTTVSDEEADLICAEHVSEHRPAGP